MVFLIYKLSQSHMCQVEEILWENYKIEMANKVIIAKIKVAKVIASEVKWVCPSGGCVKKCKVSQLRDHLKTFHKWSGSSGVRLKSLVWESSPRRRWKRPGKLLWSGFRIRGMVIQNVSALMIQLMCFFRTYLFVPVRKDKTLLLSGRVDKNM